ncbi:MAG TPA: MBG domain-containing protein, partial [Terriglobales bacterium]
MRLGVVSATAAAILMLAISASSQAEQSGAQGSPLAIRPVARITATVDDQQRVVLSGNRRPQSRVTVDLGEVPGERVLSRMMLVLRIGDEQQRALDTLTGAQQDRSSPYYHRWLTPETYAQRYGVADSDLAQIQDWLRLHGLTVDEVAASKRIIVFSGTVEQVESAFHADMREYSLAGTHHIANAAELSVPAAMAGVVEGVASLHDFYSLPLSHAKAVAPKMTTGGSHYLAPADFATIYDVRSLYNQGYDGTGQTIAIAGRSNITPGDVSAFRSGFSLPAKPPNVILVNSNPGIVGGDYDESMLDVEWAGAVSKGATIDFVTAASTGVSDGIFLAIQYIVNHNVAPVVSVSYGECEAYMGSAATSMVNSLWQQAAAQGMSVFVSAGDSGAAGCDSSSATTATAGKAVNGLCSSPYSTCVGGTEFDDTGNPTLYWNSTNDFASGSALSYIPEKVWNESGSNGLWSTGGGVSTLYSKPSWQNLAGVPADGMRDVPDVALTSAGHVAYLVVMQGSTYCFSGTSAAAPSFAGIMSLNVQAAGSSQGNANPTLYSLASRQYSGGSSSVFHDIQSGNNSVPGVSGFSAGVGYDAATGLGSVDAAQLVAHWSDNSSAPSHALTAATSSVSLGPGANVTLSLTSTVANGFNAAVAISATGLPAGVTAAFSPTTLAAPGSGSISLKLTAASTAAAGSVSVNVKATGAGITSTFALTVTVLPAPAFTFTASSSSLALLPGTTASVTLTSEGNSTFNSALSFRASGLPSGLTASFAPATLAAPGTGSSTFTIAAASTVAPGNYSTTITATAGTLSKTVKLAIAVQGIVLTSSANPSLYGSALTFSATTYGMPQVSVTFRDNGASIGSSLTTSGGTATLTTSSLMPGAHSITAIASGYSVTSAAVVQSVKAILTVSANNASKIYGSANPGFSVSYSGWVGGDTTTVLTGSPSLTTAATTASAAGSYPIAVKAGTLTAANYKFVFVPGSLTIAKASPTITLSASATAVTYGTRVSFTATVSSGGPAGLVVFYDGAASLGSGSLSGTTAAFATSLLKTGTHSITASITGSNYNPATSAALTETVGKATLTVNVNDTMIYGSTNHVLSPIYRGWVNGENVSVLTGAAALSTTATGNSAVGVYPVAVAAGSLTAANYNFACFAGTLTVTKALLT